MQFLAQVLTSPQEQLSDAESRKFANVEQIKRKGLTYKRRWFWKLSVMTFQKCLFGISLLLTLQISIWIRKCK